MLLGLWGAHACTPLVLVLRLEDSLGESALPLLTGPWSLPVLLCVLAYWRLAGLWASGDCVVFTCCEITDVYYHIWLFMWVLGIGPEVSQLAWWALLTHELSCLLCGFVVVVWFWDKISFSSIDWPQIGNSSLLASQVLGLLICATVSGELSGFQKQFVYHNLGGLWCCHFLLRLHSHSSADLGHLALASASWTHARITGMYHRVQWCSKSFWSESFIARHLCLISRALSILSTNNWLSYLMCVSQAPHPWATPLALFVSVLFLGLFACFWGAGMTYTWFMGNEDQALYHLSTCLAQKVFFFLSFSLQCYTH